MSKKRSIEREGKEPSFLVEKRDGVAIMTFNKAEAHNPLADRLVGEMIAALDEFEEDDELHAIIITGAGKSFCAGAELGNVLHPDGKDSELQLRSVRGFNKIVQRIRDHDLPVIAAVNGSAVGGGVALALSCDIAVASKSANYYFAFGRVGAASCDLGCSYTLPRIVGTIRAKHWLLTGKRLSAQEGLEAGLFVDVVPDGQVVEAALAIAAQIKIASPRRAAAVTKLSAIRGEAADFQTCVAYETYIQNYLFTTEEHRTRLRKLMQNIGMV